MRVVSSEHCPVPSFWGHHLAALLRYVVRDLGSGSPLPQKAHWGSEASFHELALDVAEISPTKALACCGFCKHIRKSCKNMSGLLLALACVFRTKENWWSFSNVEQSWYPMALPYHFRTLRMLWWFYASYPLPPPEIPSRTWRAGLNQNIKYSNFSRLCNQIFWARRKMNWTHLMSVVGHPLTYFPHLR